MLDSQEDVLDRAVVRLPCTNTQSKETAAAAFTREGEEGGGREGHTGQGRLN